MVNLVIVSHSARLGEGVGELARQMLVNDGCNLAIAAGIDDPASPIGTDPIKVMEAIESVADADHILVMMDIGSALLSAETALDLLDPAIAAKVRLCAAPLVEGTLAATVSAAAATRCASTRRRPAVSVPIATNASANSKPSLHAWPIRTRADTASACARFAAVPATDAS